MKTRSPLRWVGGKGGQNSMSAWINSFVRPHKIWIDGMCGGLSVTLGYEGPRRHEIANDVFPQLINFYKCLQTDANYLKWLIELYTNRKYSELIFNGESGYLNPIQDGNAFELATSFFVRNRMSRDGMFEEYTESPRVRRGMPEMQSSFLSALDSFEAFGSRIKNIQFSSMDILELIDYYKDYTECLIYLDPPYLHSKTTNRKTGDLYQFEVNEAFHIELLNLVRDAKCQIIISGYDEPLYCEMIPNFRVESKKVPVAMGGGAKKKNERIECLFLNTN